MLLLGIKGGDEMNKKLIALLMGVSIATTGVLYTSASASELDSSADYNIQEIQSAAAPEAEIQKLKAVYKAVTKGAGKAYDEVKSWALWDAVLGSDESESIIDPKDAEVIFDK